MTSASNDEEKYANEEPDEKPTESDAVPIHPTQFPRVALDVPTHSEMILDASTIP